MEDCKIYYDQTVRNATGAIVQFLYAEDGMNGAKVEKQLLPTIEKTLIELDAEYLLRKEDDIPLKISLTKAAYKETTKAATFDRCRSHFEDILADREFMITKVFGGAKQNSIMYPIPFERILNNAMKRSQSVGMDTVPSDLTPDHVLDNIDRLIDTLHIVDKKQGMRFLHTLLRVYLSPKVVILTRHLSRAAFDWAVAEIERCFWQSIAHAGEMVGIIAAQTMGENSTQLVLDSFHSSGTVAAVKATSGVPRFKELLSVSKNIKTPILKIYLKPDIATVDNPANDKDPRIDEAKGRAVQVMHSFEITRLSDILDATEIFYDPAGVEGLDTAIGEDKGMMDIYRIFSEVEKKKCRSQSPWVLRLRLNKDKMHNLGITMLDVYMRVHAAYSNTLDCVFSDDNADELIFRVRLSKKALKENDAEEVDSEDAIAALKAIEHNLNHNILLKGIKGIKKVSMHMKKYEIYDPTKKKMVEGHISESYDPEDVCFKRKAEWILDTDGTNLQDILGNPNVDSYRTHSNDIWEIYHTLGIEAARNALYKEIIEVVGEDSLSYRHVSLLLDTMTNRGTLMSVDRHGINRGDVGPLAKCSFEETTDMLIKASIFSEFDKINGVSANIMLGQLPPCGTGDCDIMLDEERFSELMRERNIKPRTSQVVQEDVAAEVDPCGYEAIAFQYTLPEKRVKFTIPEVVTQ
jgi:DNA-directed RNA polymerase II subunit RPB1